MSSFGLVPVTDSDSRPGRPYSHGEPQEVQGEEDRQVRGWAWSWRFHWQRGRVNCLWSVLGREEHM